MATQHTLGAKCRLAPVPRRPNAEGVPPVDAQFFYSALIPIDDPLSVSDSSRSARRELRLFGRGDNAALDKAWLGLASERHRRHHKERAAALSGRRRHESNSSSNGNGQNTDDDDEYVQDRQSLVHSLTLRHWGKHRSSHAQAPGGPIGSATVPCCPQLLTEISRELELRVCSLVRAHDKSFSVERLALDICASMASLGQPQDAGSLPKKNEAVESTLDVTTPAHTPTPNPTPTADASVSRPPYRIPSLDDDGISGKPFIRVTGVEAGPSGQNRSKTDSPAANSTGQNLEGRQATRSEVESSKTDLGRVDVEVAVGVSRLHKVTLPMLQMEPIYWSPVNDVAVVMRATWFYRDTMMPVAPAVANRLEAGYHELRPWTETWRDELSCAIEVGPLGEEKVSHPLWPQDSPHISTCKDEMEADVSSDPFCAARCLGGEAAAQGYIVRPLMPSESARPFAHYHVVYKDDTQAFLLKPSLKPSAYYGRKPVLKIAKGLTVGIPVTRGFDRQTWHRIHAKAEPPSSPGVSAARQSHEGTGPDVCPACQADKDGSQVSDLVLVAHGIGQKFAERVESFHFTHAINTFRRAVNFEMGNPVVRQTLRKDHNGLMVLPLNWRSGLSLEDGGPVTDLDAATAVESFTLKDIEPDTIPAVRSIISDVMFDIPFYMSQHKAKMIRALVSEANRVYRLWCRNNPDFATNGRVHLIAHSLGSAMALDILSRQPTTVPRLDLSCREPETRFFEFDTKNLFLLGSPAGFFLLLEHGALVPRRGRAKFDADARDIVAEEIVADAGTFGCLAVDNIYNILAKEDPIAYLLNGAVDAAYAANLTTAHVPSASTSMLASLGNAVRYIVPGLTPAPAPFAVEPHRPTAADLPSQLELEVHDFSREEIAEKKAHLLNDNGQIDWILRSGGGPLELQYLNMLSAHTSYWTNQDFIRMLCIEIGRKPGRSNTLPAMRAVKAKRRHAAATSSA